MPVAVIVNGIAPVCCPYTGKLALRRFGERSNVDGNAGPAPVGVVAVRFA